MKVERDVDLRRGMSKQSAPVTADKEDEMPTTSVDRNCRSLAALGRRDSHHRSNLREDGADAGRDAWHYSASCHGHKAGH